MTVWYDPRDPWDSGLDPSWTPVAGYALPAAAVAALLLAIHGAPIVFHDLVVAPRLATAEVWTHGDGGSRGSA